MKRILAALLAVVALLVVWVLVWSFSNRNNRQAPTALDSRPASVVVVAEANRSPLPTPLPTATASALDSIQLGEPRVVFTHTSAIGVIEWLPNSQEVLLTLQQPDVLTETIELLNIASGQRRLLAARPAEESRPVWLAGSNQVAYAMRPDTAEVRYEVRLSGSGNSQNPQRPASVGAINSDISGRGERLLVVEQNQATVLKVSANDQVAEETVIDLKNDGFEPENWRTRFRTQWSASGEKVALYDTQGFAVFDLPSGQLRRYDLGEEHSEAYGYGPRWVIRARWSPNGERIALITTVDDSTGIFRYTDLTILNVLTGEFVNTKIGRYVTDVTWDTRGRFMATLINIGQREGAGLEGIFLIDGTNGEYRQFLPKQEFWGGQSGVGIAWNPNGKQIAMNCPTQNEGRLCLVDVQINSLPK